MHLAVAIYMISTASWFIEGRLHKTYGRGLELSKPCGTLILNFVEQYRRTEGLTLKKQHPGGLALAQAGQYMNTYKAVQYYSRLLADQVSKEEFSQWLISWQASSTELARYEMCLYILQLVSNLFSWRGARTTHDQMEMAWGVFWFSLYPWEIEQVFCVQRLLERHIGSRTLSPQIGRTISLIECSNSWVR